MSVEDLIGPAGAVVGGMIGGPAGAAIGGSIGGSLGQSMATKNAASQASDATDRANQLLADQFWQTRQDNLPLMELRNALLPNIKSLALQDSNVTAAEAMADPGYQFGLNQGSRLLQGSAAARGGLHSGAAMKALTKFGNDYATTKFNDVFNRKQTVVGNNFNRMTGAAGLGQAGYNQVNQAGANYASGVGGNILNNANFQGAAGLAQSNIIGNAVNRLSSYSGGGGKVGQGSNMFTNMGYFSNLANGLSNEDVYWN